MFYSSQYTLILFFPLFWFARLLKHPTRRRYTNSKLRNKKQESLDRFNARCFVFCTIDTWCIFRVKTVFLLITNEMLHCTVPDGTPPNVLLENRLSPLLYTCSLGSEKKKMKRIFTNVCKTQSFITCFGFERVIFSNFNLDDTEFQQ